MVLFLCLGTILTLRSCLVSFRTRSVNYETPYRQVCLFPHQVRSTEYSSGVRQSSYVWGLWVTCTAHVNSHQWPHACDMRWQVRHIKCVSIVWEPFKWILHDDWSFLLKTFYFCIIYFLHLPHYITAKTNFSLHHISLKALVALFFVCVVCVYLVPLTLKMTHYTFIQ